MTREEVKKEILNITNDNILIELPTSFGKSRIAIDLIKKYKPNNILIVIPRLVLIQNWKDEFIKWKAKSYIDKITFVTYVSLPKKASNWDIVIFDECHHLSERCREALSSFTIKHSLLLSATVKKDLRFIFKAIFKDLFIYKVRIKDATESGILPDPKVYLIPLTLDTKVVNQEIVKNSKKGNPIILPFKDKWAAKKIKNRKVIIRCTQQQYYNDITSFIKWCKNRSHIAIYKQMFLRQSGIRLKWLSDQKTQIIKEILNYLDKERTLVFCNSIQHTEELGSYCINSKNKEAKDILDSFNKEKINHITACNMLDEGINLVNCRVGIYATLNSSERMIKQKLGRLLRHPNPIIIIPYYSDTRDEEIIRKMCEDYNPDLINIININNLKHEICNR